MYSRDLRERAVRLYKRFFSLRKVAIYLDISHSTVGRWLRNIDRKKYSRNPTVCSETVISTIKATLEQEPFTSTRTLTRMIKEGCGVNVSKELVRVAIKNLGFTKKKAKHFVQPKGLGDVTRKFLQSRSNFVQQDREFVSIDETSFGRNGKHCYGYALKGKAVGLNHSKPFGKTVSSLVAVSRQGIVKRTQKEGSFNTAAFAEFIKALDVPRGTVLLLDNVRFHHSMETINAASSKGFELLYTPPYSPWYNPIEEVFSIVKRSFYTDWSIDNAFNKVTQAHCKAFFDHSFTTRTVPAA